MTKRKRTASPSPAPRKRVIFEVPLSLWRFKAIASELARQSELLTRQTADPQGQQLWASQPSAPSAPHFDAQAFQTSALRFSPYPRQSILPSQPWPETTINLTSTSLSVDANGEGSAAQVISRGEEEAPQDGSARQISAGPEDQLFDELDDALHAEDDENARDSDPHTQYLTGGNRITFDPRLSSDWSGLRSGPYPPFIQGYPQIATSTSQPAFTSTTLTHHHAPHNTSSDNNFLPNTSANPPPSFSHPRPSPPQNGTQARSNMPGYYKSSLKLWSQQGQNAPLLASTSPTPAHHFGSGSVAQVPYPGTSIYPPPPPHPPPLASNVFDHFGGAR